LVPSVPRKNRVAHWQQRGQNDAMKTRNPTPNNAANRSDSAQRHFDLAADAIALLVEHREDQPSLDELARTLGVSAPHLQRLFAAQTGISPKRFLQFLNKEYAKARLAESRATLEVAFESGLSGGGRLHDLFVECEAVTPGEVRRLGRNLEIRHGVADTPFGPALLGLTPRGVCHLRFIDDTETAALADLMAEWPHAMLAEDPGMARTLASRIFEPSPDVPTTLHALVRGTNFQIRVWQALLEIPEGRLTTYGELASRLGCPDAARAVGNAVGANAIAVLIPCHRVIRESGALGGYRWGVGRKLALLAREDAMREARRQSAP
jgi:AraC family transcriptional regulator of adaptative response/methylated-DNA-[protein]-cysteine methyltransferase